MADQPKPKSGKERLARALFEDEYVPEDDERWWELYKENYRGKAQAVLEVLLDPTPEMVEAMKKAYKTTSTERNLWGTRIEPLEWAFKAAIRAAMEDQSDD